MDEWRPRVTVDGVICNSVTQGNAVESDAVEHTADLGVRQPKLSHVMRWDAPK